MKPNYKIHLLLLLLTIGQFTVAQRSEIKKAQNQYENQDYFQALEYYKIAVEKGADDLDTKLHMARCYFNLKDIQTAFDMYLGLEDKLRNEVDIRNYAACWQQQGGFDVAIEWYEKAIKAEANPLDMKELIKACKWARENGAFDQSVLVNPASSLLIGGQSFGIQFYKDEVVYSGAKEDAGKKVDNTGKVYLNLFSAKYVDGEVQEGGSSFSSNLEYDFHVGATAFTSDFKRIYYTKVVRIKGGSRIKIFTSEFNGKDWVNERELANNSDDFDIGYPAVSPDDKTLYYTSNQRGGFGGQDIYSAPIKANGDVGKGENLGKEINTFGVEKWPYISKEGKLYFASDGHLGFGGLDIFEAEWDGNNFTNVRNMRQPINTGSDDFGFILDPNDATRGFLSSNRIGSGSTDAIFMLMPSDAQEEVKKDVPPVAGLDVIPVFDETATVEEPVVSEPIVETPSVDLSMFPAVFAAKLTSTFNGGAVAGASVVIKDANTGEVVANGVSDADGKVNITIPDNFRNDAQEFEIELSKGAEFNSKRMLVHIMEIEDINNNGLSLTPIFDDSALNDIGKMVISYRGSKITDEGQKVLDQLATILQQNPNVVVKLNGHTEAKGNRYNNLDVSQTIAEVAEKELMLRGINDENMIPRGYGERYLLNKCKRGVYCDEAEHLSNRRIEVVVWKRLN
ncbi:OmpA family protein [Carboxylicivirga sp. N1Y90]|uniref:OmpA family protein n=1 Tax=Carboxylicivirga fragile TaxID=3417571 RepID=UPI003D33D6E6|nr:PD40 domain-containing protein [Marinilabiliaceae bacterium N1Y90]